MYFGKYMSCSRIKFLPFSSGCLLGGSLLLCNVGTSINIQDTICQLTVIFVSSIRCKVIFALEQVVKAQRGVEV